MKTIATRLFLTLIGLLLLTYAVGAPLLNFFGARAMGTITDVRRQGGERNEAVRDQYDYGVGYHFTLPDGRRIEGAATVVGKSYSAGVARGPAAVRYLKAFPRINILEKHTRLSIGNFILGGVGVLLMVLGLKRSGDKNSPRPAG